MRKAGLATLTIAGLMLVTASAWADGPGDYKVKCQMCHGPSGGGDTPAGKKLGAKDLKLPETKKKTESELLAIMKDGKNKMPAFKDKLNEQQMKDLVAYVRGLK